jgi:hypothetical protein
MRVGDWDELSSIEPIYMRSVRYATGFLVAAATAGSLIVHSSATWQVWSQSAGGPIVTGELWFPKSRFDTPDECITGIGRRRSDANGVNTHRRRAPSEAVFRATLPAAA